MSWRQFCAIMKYLVLLLVLSSAGATPYQTLLQGRIMNGETAVEGQFPYQVSLHISVNGGGGSFCGGSIIGNEWILTAAHCTANVASVKIYYGSIKRQESQFSHEVQADQIIRHPDYNDQNLENDISLIRTPHVDFSDNVQKVALADRGNGYEEAKVIASGWGATYDGSPLPDLLQFVEVKILPQDECNEGIGRESSNILCISTADGKSIGPGDSGGPLVTKDDPKLVGISSFIVGQIAGFNSVSYHRDWIRDNAGID